MTEQEKADARSQKYVLNILSITMMISLHCASHCALHCALHCAMHRAISDEISSQKSNFQWQRNLSSNTMPQCW